MYPYPMLAVSPAAKPQDGLIAIARHGLLFLASQFRPFEADPSPAPRAAAVWLKRIESNFSRCAATHPPLTRSPLPCEQGRVNVCGEAAEPQLSNLFPQLFPYHAAPWRRGAPKAQDGCGKAAGPQISTLNSQLEIGRGAPLNIKETGVV